MRKNFIKYLACALVAVMLLGTTAFAATTTTTTYDGTYITATTQVTGATGTEQVTYLVHNSADADIADDEIVYINQKPAVDGAATFIYKVAFDEEAVAPTGTKIIAGSTSGAALATANDNIDLAEVEIVNSTDVADAELYTVSQNWLGTEDTATLTITATDATYKVNDVEYTGAVTVEKGQTYTITKGEEINTDPSITEEEVDVVDGASVTTWATVSNLPDDAEFGVLFTINGQDLHLPALGTAADGSYAVRVVYPDGTDMTVESYSSKAYYKIGDVYTYAE